VQPCVNVSLSAAAAVVVAAHPVVVIKTIMPTITQATRLTPAGCAWAQRRVNRRTQNVGRLLRKNRK